LWQITILLITDIAFQVNKDTFPTLFAIAMDYLLMQALAMPCKHIFSSSAEIDTKKRNRISPLLMEALQMLKFHLKKGCINFTADWMMAEKWMIDDDPDEDLLCKLLDGNYQDGLDYIIQSINEGG
jgi:hAT family C-terminal dimerisation region